MLGTMFGRLADRKGRKNAMVISVTMMCGGSLLIACLPGYASIGIWAPALLLFARLVQGLSVGGEYGTTATYMSEVALRGQRGFFSSFQYVTLIGGQLLAVLVLVILQQLLSESELKAWGWRIPFVVGAITGVVALLLRRSIGRRNNMLLFGALGALTTVPILTALQNAASTAAAFALITIALAIVSLYTSISGIVKAEMFPSEVRALGVGLAYAVGNAIFGGSAEYVAIGLKTLGHESAFYWYVTVMMVIVLLVSTRLPRQAEYLHHDH